VSDPAYITVEQAAAQVSVCTKTIRRLIAEGQIPAVIVGRSVRIPENWIDALKAASEIQRLGGVRPEFVIRHEDAGKGKGR
jgi:excisionase family DNA binding protein